MYEQCKAESKTLGEVLPDWFLVQATVDGARMKAGDFGLVFGGYPEYIWPGNLVPRRDPTFGMSGDDLENMSAQCQAEWDQFLNLEKEFSKHLVADPQTGYQLIAAAMKAGWDAEEFFLEDWLLHRMALLMEGCGANLTAGVQNS